MLVKLIPKRHVVSEPGLETSTPGNGSSESPPLSLPPELWECILQHLDHKDLSRLYLLNHTFYDAFLSSNYRHVTLTIYSADLCNVKKELSLLRAMRNPRIAEKIKWLYFDSLWDANLISALDLEDWKLFFPRSWSRFALLMSGRMGEAKRQAIQETIHGGVSMLSSLNELAIKLVPLSNRLLLNTLWAACSQTLVILTLHLSSRILASGDPSLGNMTCPHLQSIHVTTSYRFTPYSQLLTDLRSLIPENGGCMEELVISMNSCQSPLIETSFQSLRKLTLYGDHKLMPSILPFLTHHRGTLQEISLGTTPSKDLRHLFVLNTSILTCLTLDADEFLKRSNNIFPFLTSCTSLKSLELSHDSHLGKLSSSERVPLLTQLLRSLPPSLTHLTFPSIVLDFTLFLAIFQNIPNISSLALHDCCPASEEIRSLFLSPECAIHIRKPRLPEESWALVFGDIQAQLDVFAQDNSNSAESNRQVLLKLFVRSLTYFGNCCLF